MHVYVSAHAWVYACLFNLCVVAGAHECECLCTYGHMHVEPKDCFNCFPLSLQLLTQVGSLEKPSAHQFLPGCLSSLPLDPVSDCEY